MMYFTGPFYNRGPKVGEVWITGIQSFEIEGIEILRHQKLVKIRCIDSLNLVDIGRITYEPNENFQQEYWSKL